MKKKTIKLKKRYGGLLLIFCFANTINTNPQNAPDSLDNKPVTEYIEATEIMTCEQSPAIDTILGGELYDENLKLIPSMVNIYDLPYSRKTHYPNYKRLALNTGVLYGRDL